MTKTIVHFGAGNIGRSLVGQLFSSAGWRVTFLDVVPAVIEALNRNGRYDVVVKDEVLPGQPSIIPVTNVSGINLADREQCVATVAEADLAGMSVGAANLPGVCGVVAEAAKRRTASLPVLLCENLHDAAAIARDHVRKILEGDDAAFSRLHFIEAAISKMVPPTPPEVRAKDPLEVWAEAYNTLYLDADAYPGTPPPVPGVAWRGDFSAYVDRKLMLHNFIHAASAFHGFLGRREFIWECMEDAAVRRETVGCMFEAARGLAARHGRVFAFDENRAWGDDLLRRFHNKLLGDTVFRVGRDLRRKLAFGDRCVGTLRMLAENGLDYGFTARAIAAGMLFRAVDESGKANPGDIEIADLAAKEGPEAVLESVCGLDAEKFAEPIKRISAEYEKLR